MATYETLPNIKIRIESIDARLLDEFDVYLSSIGGAEWWYRRRATRGVVFVDIEVAEKAVAWFKAHGVEQVPERPLRDTEMVIGEGGERTADLLIRRNKMLEDEFRRLAARPDPLDALGWDGVLASLGIERSVLP